MWEDIFGLYVKSIRENVGGMIISTLTPCFTTTTKQIQIAAQVAIMSSFKSYFEYELLCGGCGFPYICLKGSEMDYQQLKLKIGSLYGYLIDDWIEELEKIADKLIETKRGNVDINFWKNFIKNYDDDGTGYSGTKVKVQRITGWLLKFYPFLKGETNATFERGRLKKEMGYVRRDLNKDLQIGNETTFTEQGKEINLLENLPDEVIDAPLTVKNIRTGEENNLSCISGFIGMKQDNNYMVSPEIGCFLTEIK